MTSDATTRFTKRVENYRKYRPGYPAAVVEFLRRRFGLDDGSVIADVGSGTGLLSRVFLDAGFKVVGIEPNREMREAGDVLLAGSGFRSVDATAEATGLADGSVDLVVAGQAFHWFNPERTRAEWVRILRPPACVALIWNERSDESPFMRDIGAMIDRYAAKGDPDGRIRESGRSRIPGFFAPQPFSLEEFPNRQTFDYEALLGRVTSSSYLPDRGDPEYEALERDVRKIFDRWQESGEVTYEYRTRVYWGRLVPIKA